MKNFIKKFSAVLLALLIVTTYCSFAFAEGELGVTAAPDDVLLMDDAELDDYEEPPVLGEWQVGATKKDDIVATWTEGTIWFEGTGKMKDYAKPEDRPWNDIIGTISFVMFGDGIENIGKNAFVGMGTGFEEEWETADFFFPIDGALTTIGESAFENAKLYNLNTIPDTVKEIKSKAFANSGLSEIHFNEAAPVIADDAFEGCTGTFHVAYQSQFDITKSYGGDFTIDTLYKLTTYTFYDNEEMGSGTSYIPEGDDIDYFADSFDDGYGFDHYAVESGNFHIENPKDPLLSGTLSDNVVIDVYYKKGNTPAVRPEPEKEPCPFVVTKNGEAALDDMEGDYYWMPDSNSIMLLKSGLTVSMPEGTDNVVCGITASFEEPAEITLNSLHVEGPDCYLSLFSSESIKLNLVGENVINSTGSEIIGICFMGGADITFAGKGSLKLRAEGDPTNSAFCAEAFKFDKLTVVGSEDPDATSFGEVEYVQDPDAGKYGYYMKGTENPAMVLMIQPQGLTLLQNPILPIAIVIIIIAAVVIVKKLREI